MGQNLVLIAGATGQIGACVARHFMQRSGWSVLGLSRRERRDAAFPMLAVDLLDAADCRDKLESVGGLTHVVYAARYDHAGGEQESVETNLQMLANLLAALEGRRELRHIHVVHGTKYYGHYLGPRQIPYQEDAPRHDTPLFYYPQQDLLVQQQEGRRWGWSISRPHAFCDLSLSEPRSITLLVAVYASLLKELGQPLKFPGTHAAFEAKMQFTWLPMLARSIEWMISDPACANQAFNVVNGDPVSWRTLWPAIADYFGMPWSISDPVALAGFPDGHNDIWSQMVSTYQLRGVDLKSLGQWTYADYVFRPQWDVVSSMEKARRYGFTERIDTVRMWRENFDFYRAHNIIP